MAHRPVSRTAVLAASLLGLAVLPALAQDSVSASDAPIEQQKSDESTTLDAVKVTGAYVATEKVDMATGLGLTPQETPQSVSVITTQQLQDQNLTTITDVVAAAVGVSTSEIDDVRNTFYARGFEITNYQIDGVPLAWSLAGDSGETIIDTAIYERIEFVRGATGLLTGAGDPSASINLVRKHADAREFTGFVEAGYGRWDRQQITADVGAPLNESGSVRARVVGKFMQGDSYMDLYEDDKNVFYGVVDADLTPETTLRVGASRQNNDPTAPTWGALPYWFSDGSKIDWPRSTTTAADWTRWETTNRNYFANIVHSFSNGWTLTADYNRLENEQSTRLLYLYGVVDRETGEGLSAYPYRSNGTSKQDSFDAQLKGFFDAFGRRHEFAVGALHSEQNADTTAFAALEFPIAGSLYTWDGSFPQPGWSSTGSKEVKLRTKQEGVYAVGRFSLTDPLHAVVGGRVSNWERDGFSYGVTQNYGDDGVFVPYAGLLYDLTPAHRLYASYTEIFQPQNERHPDGQFLDPVTGKSVELGLKSRFLGDALQTSVAVFMVKQDGLAQAIPGVYVDGTGGDGGLPEQAYRAANGTKTKGFEVEVVGQPVEGLNVSFGYTQFHADDADGAAVNTDVPHKLLKLFATYALPGALHGLTVGGGVTWQDDIYAPALNPVTEAVDMINQDAYALVNLMARYDFNQRLSLQANVANLTDKKYFSQVGFFDQYRYGDPRNYTLTLRYRF